MHYQSFIKDYQIVVKPARRSIIDGNAIEIAAHRIKFKDCKYVPRDSEHMTKKEEEKYLDMRIEKQRRIRMWKITDAELKLAKEKGKEMARLNAKYKALQDEVDKTKPMNVRDKRFVTGTSGTVNPKEEKQAEEIEEDMPEDISEEEAEEIEEKVEGQQEELSEAQDEVDPDALEEIEFAEEAEGEPE